MPKKRVDKNRSIYDSTQRADMESIFDNMQGQIDRQKAAITRLLGALFDGRAAFAAIADPESGLDADGMRQLAQKVIEEVDAAEAAAKAPDTED